MSRFRLKSGFSCVRHRKWRWRGRRECYSQVTCHQLVSVTVVATHCGVVVHIVLLSLCPKQQQSSVAILGLKFGRSTVKVAKVKSNASTDEMVANGSVRRQDKDGNEAADRAADLNRRRQPELFNQRQKANPKCFTLLVRHCF